jgi:hypothetical protein
VETGNLNVNFFSGWIHNSQPRTSSISHLKRKKNEIVTCSGEMETKRECECGTVNAILNYSN